MRIRSRGFLPAAAVLLSAACSPVPAPDGGEAGLEPPPGAEGSGAPAEIPSEARPASAPPLVLFVGTSLTEGFGLPDPAREAWPAQVAARAEAEGLTLRFRNAGLSGETSAGALRRIDWVLDEPPAVLVLEVGANDGLRGLPASELEANLDAILERAREVAPGARIVLAGMEAPPNLGSRYASEFREVYPRVADRWGAALIPFLLDGVAGVPGLNQPDRIHPTAQGHRRMAEVAWPVLAPLLRQASERFCSVSPRPGSCPAGT